MSEHLLDRIYGEYQAYRVSVLSLSNAEIFTKCYEIDIMTNLYEILLERIGQFSDDIIKALLVHENVLAELYDRWLKKDDANYAELEKHILDEIRIM